MNYIDSNSVIFDKLQGPWNMKLSLIKQLGDEMVMAINVREIERGHQ